VVDIFAALVMPSQIATSSVFGAVILPDAVLDGSICYPGFHPSTTDIACNDLLTLAFVTTKLVSLFKSILTQVVENTCLCHIYRSCS